VLRSARQVHLWLRDEGIVLPAKSRQSAALGVVWKLPAYNAVHNILTNPIYAGAYAFGRTGSQVSVVEGRKHIRRGVRRAIAEWDVLLKDQHEGYITWDEFERNQHFIADNATGMGRTIARGAVRQREVLLAGLLRCGHCGRKLQVHYSGRLGSYTCYGARMNHGTARCISFGNRSADAAVCTEVLRVLAPLGMDAAVKVLDTQTSETSATERQLKLALTQAQYEVAYARRQYDAVDPANRLVAGELERRWNEALAAVHRIEGEIAAAAGRKRPPLGEIECKQLMALGADLARAWTPPAATAVTRKRILRTALYEIVVKREGPVIDLVLHWQGGDHTALQLKLTLNAAGRHHSRHPEVTITLVRELARLMPDAEIARLLNRRGKSDPRPVSPPPCGACRCVQPRQRRSSRHRACAMRCQRSKQCICMSGWQDALHLSISPCLAAKPSATRTGPFRPRRALRMPPVVRRSEIMKQLAFLFERQHRTSGKNILEQAMGTDLIDESTFDIRIRSPDQQHTKSIVRGSITECKGAWRDPVDGATNLFITQWRRPDQSSVQDGIAGGQRLRYGPFPAAA